MVLLRRKDRPEMAQAIVASDSLTLRRPSCGRLKIGRDALKSMRGYIQDSPEKTEACGVLLGRYIKDTDDVVVDSVTVPTRGDRRTRLRYFRARKAHQEQIDIAWARSRGTSVYLGEWHTHPVATPVPSTVDILDWRRKLLVDSFARYLFFLILGTHQIGMWEGRRHRWQLEPLRLQEGSG